MGIREQIPSSHSKSNYTDYRSSKSTTKTSFKAKAIRETIVIMLIILWSYAALTKLFNLEKSRADMLNQIFPIWISEILFWLVPVIELALAFLLLFHKTRLPAIVSSVILLIAFSIYIGLVMSGIFGRIPCSCGGILSGMSYSMHLVFNLFYALIASVAIYLYKFNY